MARYSELYALRQNGSLKQRISIAVVITADNIGKELNTVKGHDLRLKWAQEVLKEPMTTANEILYILLGRCTKQSQTQILSTTDSVIQTAVDSVVNLLAGVV